MNEGKLSKTDVSNKRLYLDRSVRGLFKRFIGQEVKIVNHDDGCEFLFCVKQSYLFQTKTEKEDKDKDFFDLLVLDEGDEILFKYDDKRNDKYERFYFNIKKKTSSSIDIVSIDEHEKKELIKSISDTYKFAVNIYDEIFKKRYLPTKASQHSINGFTERNLTFNFCHSYLTLNSDAIVWQEIPINSPKKQHVDSIIIDKEKDLVIYLEAKRLYDVPHFKDLLDDLNRIKKQHSNIPLPLVPPSKKVVILLADHICDGKKDEKDFYDKYFTGQKDIDLPKINEKKHSNLAKKLPNMIKLSKISAFCDNTQAFTLCGEYNNNNNISIEKDILYTIYCGIYFIE